MKNRLAEFLKVEGLSSGKFAEIMEIPPSSVSHLLAGRNNPGFDFLVKMITRFPEISPDWLLTGNDTMYRTKEDIPQKYIPNSEMSIKNQVTESIESPKEIISAEPKVFETHTSEKLLPLPDKNQIADHEQPEASKIERIILLLNNHTFEIYNK